MVKQRTKSEEHNWFRVVNRLGGKCARCGCTENLEVDHKDPREKLFEVKSRLSYKWVNLIDEVDKCQLLCKPCHKDKTYNEDWDVIKEKKREFLHVKTEYLPLLDEHNLTICIDTSKRDGRAYEKMVEHRAKKTGNTFHEVLMHDHLIYELSCLMHSYYQIVNEPDGGWLPDAFTEEKESKYSRDELEQFVKEKVGWIKNASQDLYDELYKSASSIHLSKKDKEAPFSKIVNNLIEDDEILLYDKWIDITLMYKLDHRKVLKSAGY